MKISELIKILEKTKLDKGDMEIVSYKHDGYFGTPIIGEVSGEQVGGRFVQAGDWSYGKQKKISIK